MKPFLITKQNHIVKLVRKVCLIPKVMKIKYIKHLQLGVTLLGQLKYCLQISAKMKTQQAAPWM